MRATPDIALMGRARAGKDSVADYLTESYGYTKLGFADPVKDVALAMDPWVPYDNDDTDPSCGISAVRLSFLVDRLGWESAKDSYPEVRRLLVGLGHGMRQQDEDVWLRLMMGRIDELRSAGGPVVVSGTRYANEYHTLRSAKFRMVRVHRDAAEAIGVDPGHDSEKEISQYHAHSDVRNDGSVADLHRAIDDLLAR